MPAGVRSAAVAVGVAGQRALHAVPCRARRVLRLVPAQAGLAAALLPFRAQAGLGFVEAAAGMAGATLPTGAVGGRVVLVAVLLVVVGLALVVLAPVAFLHRRIDRFANGLAAQAAGHRAHRGANHRAPRAGHRTHGGAGGPACRRAHAGTHRVRTGRAGDRIAVGVVLVVVHGSLLADVCRDMSAVRTLALCRLPGDPRV